MYINNLITGTMTLGSGGSTPTGHSDTRVTYTAESGHADWSGEIEGELTYGSIPNISDVETVDIGTSVTSIGYDIFLDCSNLTSITIPQSVTEIGNSCFGGCSNLMSVTFIGKDRATVQDMNYYHFALDYSNENGVTIHCSDGDIQISYSG